MCGCLFGWNLSRSCPAPSRNAVMGRIWHREATSQFSGKGKMSARKARKTYPAATAGCTRFTSAAFRPTERFACIMFDSTTSYDKVNDFRQDLLYQNSWRTRLKPIVAAPNPGGFGLGMRRSRMASSLEFAFP